MKLSEVFQRETPSTQFIVSNDFMDTFYVEDEAMLSPLLFGNSEPGQPYIDAILDHTASILSVDITAYKEEYESGTVAVVSIPRGGVPVGVATKEILEWARTELHLSDLNPILVESNEKTDKANLFPAEVDFDAANTLILADGVVGTGSTIIRHMEQIPEGWQGTVKIVNNIAAQKGIDLIAEFAAQRRQKVKFITGKIYPEEECDYVDVGEGKLVYFVGMNDDVPDFGDHVSAVGMTTLSSGPIHSALGTITFDDVANEDGLGITEGTATISKPDDVNTPVDQNKIPPASNENDAGEGGLTKRNASGTNGPKFGGPN